MIRFMITIGYLNGDPSPSFYDKIYDYNRKGFSRRKRIIYSPKNL